MRLLLDENIPHDLLLLLQEAGEDVVHVADSMKGSDDGDVLRVATEEQRVILTCDKGFGERALTGGSRSAGMIVFRLRASSSDELTAMMFDRWMDIRDRARGNLVVVGPRSVRIRKLE